jgi:hypothetical protein
MTTETYDVPVINLSRLVEKLAAYAKKASKLGGEITWQIGESFIREVTLPDQDAPGGFWRFDARFVEVTVTGETPMIGGHEFMARIDHEWREAEESPTGEAGWHNFVFVAPGQAEDIDDLVAAYRHTEPMCEHCQLDRRRKQTYLLRDESTGDLVQIGSSCLRDFTGANNPHYAASFAELFLRINNEIGEGDFYGLDRSAFEANLIGYLAWTRAAMRAHGWVSAGDVRAAQMNIEGANPALAYAVPTGQRAWMAFVDKDSVDYEPTDADVELANRIYEWVRGWSLEEVEESDYNFKLSLIFAAGTVRCEHRMLAASAVKVFLARQEREIRQAYLQQSKHHPVEDNAMRNWSGMYCLSVREQHSIYGPAAWHTFVECSTGNVFTWKASASATWCDEGTVYTLRAKLHKNAHGEWNGVAQTRLTRVSIKKVEAESAQPPWAE